MAKKPLRLRFIKTITQKALIQKGDHVLVALSGGADSVALLWLVKSIEARFALTIRAIHINHCIRGEESDGDEAFCAELCQALDIPLIIERIDIPKLASHAKKSIELVAREVRYQAFEKAAKAYGCNKIATAHNQNDNAETIIYNLIRGSGARGLKGIPYKRGAVIRPLLDASRREIIEFLGDKRYCTDSTNKDFAYTRNRIRHTILPILQAENPAFLQAAASLAESLTIDDDFITKQLENADISSITTWHTALISRYVIGKIEKQDLQIPDRRKLKAIINALKTGESNVFLLQNGMQAVVNGDLTIQPRKNQINSAICIDSELKLGENIFDHGLFKITLMHENLKNFKQINKFSTINMLCSVTIKDSLKIRARKPSDKIRINGMTKLVKKELIAKKIPRECRDTLPIICHNDQIVCIPYIGTDDRFKARENSVNLRISIEFAEK